MYLVLKGTNPQQISILTATKAQEDLVKEILEKKASWHRRFGLPRTVSCIFDSQTQANQFVIASLVRSSAPGMAAHPEWLSAILGKAKTGLFLLCNLDLFNQLESVNKLLKVAGNRSHKLELNYHGQSKVIESYAELYRVNQELFGKTEEVIN